MSQTQRKSTKLLDGDRDLVGCIENNWEYRKGIKQFSISTIIVLTFGDEGIEGKSHQVEMAQNQRNILNEWKAP